MISIVSLYFQYLLLSSFGVVFYYLFLAGLINVQIKKNAILAIIIFSLSPLLVVLFSSSIQNWISGATPHLGFLTQNLSSVSSVLLLSKGSLLPSTLGKDNYLVYFQYLLTAIILLNLCWAIVSQSLKLRNLTHFRRKLKPCTHQKTILLLDRLLKELDIKKEVIIKVSSCPVTPHTFGLFSPIIVLDQRTMNSESDLEYILAHELGHIKNADYLMNFLFQLYLSTQVMNPLIHWLTSEFKLMQEVIADQAVLAKKPSQKKRYTELLIELMQSARDLPQNSTIPLSIIFKKESLFKRRVEMIFNQKKNHILIQTGRLICFSLVCLVSLFTVVSYAHMNSNFPSTSKTEIELAYPSYFITQSGNNTVTMQMENLLLDERTHYLYLKIKFYLEDESLTDLLADENSNHKLFNHIKQLIRTKSPTQMEDPATQVIIQNELSDWLYEQTQYQIATQIKYSIEPVHPLKYYRLAYQLKVNEEETAEAHIGMNERHTAGIKVGDISMDVFVKRHQGENVFIRSHIFKKGRYVSSPIIITPLNNKASIVSEDWQGKVEITFSLAEFAKMTKGFN